MTFGNQGLFGFITAGEGGPLLTSHNSQDYPTAENDPAPNANSSEVEKPSSAA